MATIGNTVLTLTDWAKRLDPNGAVASTVELLAQTNEVLQDMLWMEGNLPTGHRTTVRTSLPSVGWRMLNNGVTPSKSTTAQVDDGCGMLEAVSEVDVDLVKLNGNSAAFRLSEAHAFLEAMNQEMAQTLFYGDAGTAPEEFTGLASRYPASTATNGQNVIKAGGSGSDNTSIYLVVWGANTVHGIFPKGSKAGVLHEDLGEQLIQTSTGIGTGRLKAFVDRWQWKCGISLRDWRYVVRIANIDISNLVAESSAADLIKVMIKAIHRLPSTSMGRPVFYANRTVKQMLDIQAMSKTNVHLQAGEEEGRPKLTLRGIPIRTCDALLETEATVA
jgi:hypothetical protein